METVNETTGNIDLEKQDWLDALDELLETEGPDRVKDILHDLQVSAHRKGVRLPFTAIYHACFLRWIVEAIEEPLLISLEG